MKANKAEIIETVGLTKRFGGLTAISDFNFKVKKDEIVGLIGPNGAGKSTLINLLSGYLRPTQGEVVYGGRSINHLGPNDRVELGLTRIFQAEVLFKNMTVKQNLEIAFHLQANRNFWATLLRLKSYREKENNILHRGEKLMEFFGLTAMAGTLAKDLPHGYKRALAVAMSIATGPQLLLLDEPLTGMNPKEVDAFLELLRKIRERGITLLIIEHNMRAIMRLSERIVVMNFGYKLAEGTPEEIVKNEQVIQAYLGRKATHG